jgi:hypothetical protein
MRNQSGLPHVVVPMAQKASRHQQRQLWVLAAEAAEAAAHSSAVVVEQASLLFLTHLYR